MRKFIYIITLILFTVVSVQSQQDEWTYLFDGKTLNGWHEYKLFQFNLSRMNGLIFLMEKH